MNKKTFLLILIRFILDGIEYAVILPTLWAYLETFHAPDYMYGLALAAYSMADLIFSPVYGRITDRLQNLKWLVACSNLFEILGSLLYFVGISPWLITFARFLAGCGSGGNAALIAEITRKTEMHERTRILSQFMMGRQLGLIIGPGCNFFLAFISVKVWIFELNKYNMPGLFMAALWLLHLVFTLMCYKNFHSLIPRANSTCEYEEEQRKKLQPQESLDNTTTDDYSHEDDVMNNNCHSINPDTQEHAHASSEEGETRKKMHRKTRIVQIASSETERYRTRKAQSHAYQDETQQEEDADDVRLIDSTSEVEVETCKQRHTSLDSITHSMSLSGGSSNFRDTKTLKLTRALIYDTFIRHELVALLNMCFITSYLTTGCEALLAPVTSKILFWNEIEISILFIGCGIEIIAVFFLITKLSTKISDKRMVLFGLICLSLSVAVFVSFIPGAIPGHPENIVLLVIGTTIYVFSMPFIFTCSMSLLSKLVSNNMQGLTQGIRRSFSAIGLICGPIWASATLKHLYVNYGVMLGTVLFATALYCFSYSKYPDGKEVDIVDSES